MPEECHKTVNRSAPQKASTLELVYKWIPADFQCMQRESNVYRRITCTTAATVLCVVLFVVKDVPEEPALALPALSTSNGTKYNQVRTGCLVNKTES